MRFRRFVRNLSFKEAIIVANRVKQPVLSEQGIYEATVLNFLKVSRRYLVTTGPVLTHLPRPGGGGGYPSGLFTLLPTGRRHLFLPFQKQR